jgi:CelD/BcsL family acetyltransferase involved in cellulose biosynthesis
VVDGQGACYEAFRVSLRKYEGFSVFAALQSDLKTGARSLFARCPWRTVFTHPDFLAAWYQSRPALHPILLSSFMDGAVDGLVALAADQDQLLFAGGSDVPVHGWLAGPLRGSFVVERHLREVVRGADRVRISPPPGAPIDWLSESRSLGRFARVERRKRRIFRLDPERAKQKLDEKKNTSQMPQVKALGPLALKPARAEDFAAHVEWYQEKRHARGLQASLHRERLDLYRRLDPEILSATVLTAGDTVLSAMLVYRDGPRAWLELLAENPEHERHSPGILHLYALEERWIGEVSQIDVTADDDWMHLIAEETEAPEFELLFRAGDRMRRRASQTIRRIVSRR